MGLNAEMAAVAESFWANAPKPIVDPIKQSVADLKAAHDPSLKLSSLYINISF
jgi:hypothetical protein